ncbi:MAG: hypothetical protein QG602_1316 [Verrucomicrobiota bacterium]|nr:hypothetical protein [Verrucomicrobiota bacterium]
MRYRPLSLPLVVLGLCTGCVSTTSPESTSYAEWKQEQRARWEAKKTGTEYKTKDQVRKEAEEMRAVAAEVMGVTVKPGADVPAAGGASGR